MTEAEWMVSHDAKAMVEFVCGRTTDRKLRLFAVAACHRIDLSRKEGGHSRIFADGPNGRIIDAVEAGTDALFGEVEMSLAAMVEKPLVRHTVEHLLIRDCANVSASEAAKRCAFAAPRCFENWSHGDVMIADVVREIFGNPFAPKTDVVGYGLGPVLELAEEIYAKKSFERMPELAGMLASTGIKDVTFVKHFHSAKPHFRGCWALDLLLGKS